MSNETKPPLKVLIVKTSSLGDVIHTLPALTDAARALPGIRFDWVVEKSFSEIPGWHPAVDKVIPVSIRSWRKQPLQTWRNGEWKTFRDTLKRTPYDLVIDAQGLLKSAVLTRGLKAPVYGLDKHSAREPLAARFYSHPQAVAKGQHAVERTRQLFAQALGYTCPKEKGSFRLNADEFQEHPELRPANPYLVFVHGTTWATKHWPDVYWCELAKAATDAGFDICLPWGNEQEKQRAELIARTSSKCHVLPRLSLKGVASVIAGAQQVVAVDTGLGHLTAALEVPGTSLYGPTSPVLVGAYGAAQQYLTADNCPQDNTRKVEPEIFAPLTPDIVWQALQQQAAELAFKAQQKKK